MFIVTIFLLLSGQKTRNSGSDRFSQLFNNSILSMDTPINDFDVRLKKNRVLMN